METKITIHTAAHRALCHSELGRQTCFNHRLNQAPVQKPAEIQVITFFLAAGSSPGCLTENPVLADQMGTLLILGLLLILRG